MSKTAEQVNALKEDIQLWMERNNLLREAQWATGPEFYGQRLTSFASQPYLVLTSPDVRDVTWDWDANDPLPHPDAERLREEFRGIVKRHGFYQSFDDGPTLYFQCDQEVQADYDRQCERAREANEIMQEKMAAGWTRKGQWMLVHPEDEERLIMYDPYAQEFLLSAKEAALLVEEIRRAKAECAERREETTAKDAQREQL